MPAGREGKRAALISFAFLPINFHGAGGRGGAGFGGSLPSAAALLIYACQRVGRASVLIFFFSAYAVQFSRTGGPCFRGISTIGGGAFGRYMPAGREGERAALISFAFLPLNFHGAGGRGGAGFGGSLPSAALLIYACQRVGRASVLIFFFSAYAVQFSRIGRRYFREISTVGGGTFGRYMSVEREGKRAILFSFALSPMIFHGAGWRGGPGFDGLLPSTAAALWNMHASVSGGRAY